MQVHKQQSTSKIKAQANRGALLQYGRAHKGIIDLYTTKAEDERTAIAKQDFKDAKIITIDAAHAANH